MNETRPGTAPARTRRRWWPGTAPGVRRTRVGGWWVALVAAAIVLLLLLIFMLQNGHSVGISFLGAHADLPLGVALLLAAVAGVLIVAIPGSGRIVQLRRLAQHPIPPPTPAPRPAAAPEPDVADAPDPPNPSDNEGRPT